MYEIIPPTFMQERNNELSWEDIQDRRMAFAIERMQGIEEEEMQIFGFEETKEQAQEDDDHTVSYDDEEPMNLSVYDDMDLYDHYFISDKDTVVPEYDDFSFENEDICSFEENLDLDQQIDINNDYEFEIEIQALMEEVDRRNNNQY